MKFCFFSVVCSFWHRSALAVGEKLVYSNKLHTHKWVVRRRRVSVRAVHIDLQCAMAHKRLIWNLNIIRNFNLMFWFTSEINSFDRRDYFLLKQNAEQSDDGKKIENKRKFMMSFMLQMGISSIVLARRREKKEIPTQFFQKFISKNCHTRRHPTTGNVRVVLSHWTWPTILFAFGELFWPCADWSCVCLCMVFLSLFALFFLYLRMVK